MSRHAAPSRAGSAGRRCDVSVIIKPWDDRGVSALHVRDAVPADVPSIRSLVADYAHQRILLEHDHVSYYEAIRDFVVAEQDGQIIGCGALHILWKELGEIRTVAVDAEWKRSGVGSAVITSLVERARELGLTQLFCLTFEVEFFARHGFVPVEGDVVPADVYQELLLSHDDGVAQFLDLARVKPNTLGNTRMLRMLHE